MVEAHYAPAHEWSNNDLVLKDEKSAGTEEHLTYSGTQTLGDAELTITFGSRNYSRLRVVAAPDMTVTLTAAAFTANDGTTSAESGIKATADAKGNAYFYGTWATDATLVVTLKEDGAALTDVSKTIAKASVAGNSYALDGLAKFTTYNQFGEGTVESPYRIYNTAQLIDFDATFTEKACDKHLKLRNDIDLTGKEWATIGTPYTNAVFTGTFDGDFHPIKGLKVYSTIEKGYSVTGFIANVGVSAVVKNLIIEDCDLDNTSTNSILHSLVSMLERFPIAMYWAVR